MNKLLFKEGQWEGFENCRDITETNHSDLPSIKNMLGNESAKSKRISNEFPLKKACQSKKKYLTNKKSEGPRDNNGNASPSEKSQHRQQLQNQEKLNILELKKVQTASSSRKFERIPIIKYEEEYNSLGRIIYKGFVPRSSDNYFKQLKEVDTEKPMQWKKTSYAVEFNSQFQGGNLNVAVEELEYDLYMKVDSNTNGHRQWFYFAMRNQTKCTVRIHIFRFKKIYSLFQRGMRPYIRSRKAQTDWGPGGDKVAYHYEKQSERIKNPSKSFVLSFSYTFQHDDDEVYVAAGIPYTYTFLQKQLISFKELAQGRPKLKFEVTAIGRSMCGLDIPLLTIEHQESLPSDKKFIIINTRTHSGEASSSWVLDGLLIELVSSQQIEEWLLQDNVSFKIVPMLNPDGVFIGNYRTGIIGDDFNRKFFSCKKEYHPEIFALKKLVLTCKKLGCVELFLDLHGHSVLKNSFLYGPAQGELTQPMYQYLASTLSNYSKYFRFSSCKFQTRKDENIQTARIFFQQKQEILAFTCENSLGLFSDEMQSFQMLKGDWQSFGKSLAQAFKDVYRSDLVASHKSEMVKPTVDPPKKPRMSIDLEKKVTEERLRSKITSCTSKNNSKLPLKIPELGNKKDEKRDNSFELLSHISTSQELSKNRRFERLTEKFTREKRERLERVGDMNRIGPLEMMGLDKLGKGDNRLQREMLRTKFKVRKQSQILKLPIPNLNFKTLGRIHMDGVGKQDYLDQSVGDIGIQRAHTFDSMCLKDEFDKISRLYLENEANEQPLDMEVIPENLSDEYSSINDQDSDSEDLKDQEKNYILDYIRANQIRHDERMVSSEAEEEAAQNNFEAKINNFREIRFKSVEQDVEKEVFKNHLKRMKVSPHKFPDGPVRHLKTKESEFMLQTDGHDPTMVTITQKKKLNERNTHYRKTPKESFMLKDRPKQMPC